MLSFWHDILNRFNEVSNAMQKSDVLLSTVDVMLMTFEVTCEKAPHSDTFFDGLAIDTAMDARSTFIINTLLIACIDSLETERKRRGYGDP